MSTLEARGESRPMISLGFDEEPYPRGTHMCFIFNDEDERRWVMSKCIQSGLDANEQVGYYVDTMSPDGLKKWMRDQGVTLPDELDGRQYSVVDADQAYCPDGTFNVDRMIETVREAHYRSLREGYAGARIAGEMSWVKRGHPGSENLVEYECRINVLMRTVPTTAVCQYDAQRFDGATLYDILSVHPMMIVHGQVVRNPYYVEAEDRSLATANAQLNRQAAESARGLVAAEDLVRTVMASAAIGVALADLDGSFRVVNRSLCDLLGYSEAYLLAHRLPDFVHPDDADEALRARAGVIAGASNMGAGKLRLVRADGATVWVRRVSVLLPGGDGQPNLVMVQVEDITAEHEAQEALTYQAFHDPLTGLHNRAWILDILAVDLRAAKRLGHSVGALFVDLDNFKVVNDSLGHGAGDEVLATVAGRIVAALRPGDRVGRFGGDEFVIVVQDVHDVLEVERCAERVSASIAVDVQVRGHRIVPTASIGIATSTSASTPESLLGDADSALSRAKAAGRARWHFFDEAMHAQAVARLTVEDELREAITAGEFVVYYQPIVALADPHVVGHEALVRWAHPTRKLLSPGDFLDVAEDTGLITAIGAQVLDQVCVMLAERPALAGPISVNISAVQLAAPGWLTSVRDTLAARRVDPVRIVIEVTETAVLSLVDSARVALATLRELGVGIYVDDFGTGYSSISLLRDLPVTGVKLDLRFVQDLTAGDSQANALAQGVSGLVEGMHLTGVAEGIETKMQADLLRAQGWECGQGYYFGRPVAAPMTSH